MGQLSKFGDAYWVELCSKNSSLFIYFKGSLNFHNILWGENGTHITLLCMYGLFPLWNLLLGELNSLNKIYGRL